jgi:uncharacterized protein YbaA (DUF1428 family)
LNSSIAGGPLIFSGPRDAAFAAIQPDYPRDASFRDVSHPRPKEIRMAQYVDGFVVPVPKRKVDAYRRIARKAGKIWREHGALEYRECVGDDVPTGKITSFPRSVKVKRGETVVFSWIVFKSRAHRDRVNAKVMKDPRLADMMDPKAMPFDTKRMIYGGFNVVVDV